MLFRLKWLSIVSLMLALSVAGSRTVHAADAAFFGVLSLLDDDAVVQKLALTQDQQAALTKLIVKRESAALSMAMKLKNVAADERGKLQADFVAESEKEGFALLTEQQREALRKLSISRAGASAMTRDEVADQLQLSGEQRKEVADLIRRREAEVQKVAESKQGIVRAVYERRLFKLLSEEQRQAWASMTEVTEVAAAAPADSGAERVASSNNRAAADQPLLEGLSADEDGNLFFNFGYAPWKTVLEWFATEADLSLVMDAPPPGTFNLIDRRSYSPSEAIDVINSVLLTKGYTLVRRERMLLLINLEDGIPPNLVTTVPASELDDRGEFELVGTLFHLGSVSAEDAETEIRKLIGPQGDLQVLGKAKQAFVTETAGRLRTIRDVLRAMDDPSSAANTDVATIELKHILPEEAFTVIRQMMGMPEELLAMPDGSLRLGTDVIGDRLMLTGQPERIAQVRKLIELVDVATPVGEYTGGGILATPQLEVYPVTNADSQSVYDVVDTMLAEEDVKLAIDPKTGNLVVMGLPSHHATIRAVLAQMQQGGQEIEVILLDYVDPQRAVLAINQLFSGGADGENDNAPVVSADVTSSQLLVRGTRAQIDQIRELLDRMGEGEDYAGGSLGSSQNVRVLSLDNSEANRVLEQIEAVWPSMRQNKIRRVVPSAVSSSINQRDTRRDGDAAEGRPADESGSRRRPFSPTPTRNDSRREAADDAGQSSESADTPEPEVLLEPTPSDVGTINQSRYLAQIALPGDSANNDVQTTAAAPGRQALESVPGDPIVVSIGASGLIIASRDLDALDDFEDLVLSIAGDVSATSRDFAVFYLRHATAASATELLNTVLGGGASAGTSAPAGGGGGGLLDSLMGDMGAGLMDSLLGSDSGGSLTASGSFSIVPEARLNLLLVQANAADMDLIESLLQIIDQRTSPETVETIPSPRLIQLYNSDAEQVAGVIREIFSKNLVSGQGGQQRQPSPEDFIRALRGGRGGQGGGGAAQEEKKELAIGVDSRNNQLVVAAPDELFEQVKALAMSLDVSNPETGQTTRVVTLGKANPEMVRRALQSIVGNPTEATSSSGRTGGQASGGARTGGQTGRGGGDQAEAARRNFEMMRAIQSQQGGGDRGGRGGRGGGGGDTGGRGGRGGRGR